MLFGTPVSFGPAASLWPSAVMMICKNNEIIFVHFKSKTIISTLLNVRSMTVHKNFHHQHPLSHDISQQMVSIKKKIKHVTFKK